MGQIKNIKLHIVTDIKMRDLTSNLQLDNERKQGNIHDILSNGSKVEDEFRNYDENVQPAIVRETYRKMHENQTVEFVKKQQEKWLQFNHGEMTLMDAIVWLDELIDSSDPDTDLPNSVHAF